MQPLKYSVNEIFKIEYKSIYDFVLVNSWSIPSNEIKMNLECGHFNIFIYTLMISVFILI